MLERFSAVRLFLSLAGLGALLAHASLPGWALWAGCGLVAGAELLGLCAAGMAAQRPAARLLLAGCEAAPGMAIATFAPAALFQPAAVAVYWLLAGGLDTVSVARGKGPAPHPGEWVRRILTGTGNLALLVIPVSGRLHIELAGEVTTLALALVAMAGARAVLDTILALRSDTRR
ncbi:MAG: hypothetical protein IT463_08760 [Planctomycetes bacterium]|nr:hypothetical protein [Planctomycetota bacterium]